MLYLFVFLGLDGAITRLNRRRNRRYRDARKWVSTSFPRSLQYFHIDTIVLRGRFLPSFLPSFSPFLFPFYLDSGTGVRSCRCGKKKAKGRKRRTRRSEGCLEGAIEIRIEFARIAKRAWKGFPQKPKRAESPLRQTFFTSSLPTSIFKSAQFAKYILIVADGGENFRIGYSSKSTLARLLPLFHIRRMVLPTKSTRDIRATIASGGCEKQKNRIGASIFADQLCPVKNVRCIRIAESLFHDGQSFRQESF